jgi:hypothetical protein
MSNNTQSKDLYLGNQNLPTEKAEFEWTPEMVRDLKKSRQNILHFAEHFFYIVNLDRGKDKISLYKYQKRILRALRDNRFNIVLSSRQSGKTTLMTIYALWMCCFYEDQRILIVANKEQTAINIFKRVRMAYEMLPNWLKPGVREYGKTSMTLGNGSSIGISTTSSDAGRGDSCNVLILDELAFIDNHLVENFWKSVYPIISSSKKSKIFIASTPNGTENLFYNLYSNAIKGDNNWHPERVDWHEVPGRDEQWKHDTIRSLGSKDAFDQEFGNKFIESGESIVDDDLYQKFGIDVEEPRYIYEEGHYHIWREPNKDNIYVAGVDIAEGVNENASVIQILDITNLAEIEQVACYHSNKISPYNFTSKLLEILKHWGSPPALIERNNCGAQVVDNLKNQYGYENIVNYAPNIKNQKYDRPGVVAHTNTKYKGVTNMRYWVNELRSVTIRDNSTINEIKNFIRYPNGTWAARKGDGVFDDRVMSLIWALMILEIELTEKYFEIVRLDDNNKPAELKIFDYGLRAFEDPTLLFRNEKESEEFSSMPIIFPGQTGSNDEISRLEEQGWERMV